MKWKCLQSGNIIEFTNDTDNEIMEQHDGYVKVEEVEVEKPAKQAKPKKEQAE